MILAILVGFALPMTATQILWINLVLASTPGLVLAFEPGVMARAPRKAGSGLSSPFLLWRVVLVSALMAGAALGVFFWALQGGRDMETARTLVVNMLVVANIFYLCNVRYLQTGSLTLKGALGTPAVLGAILVVVAAQLAFTYWPPMQAVFESRALSVMDLAVLLTVGAALFVALEIEKATMRRLGWFGELAGERNIAPENPPTGRSRTPGPRQGVEGQTPGRIV